MSRAEQLRAAFDAGFAAPRPEAAAPTTDLLRFRIGGQVRALRLAEIASLHADLPITHLPATTPAMLGVSMVRGALIPIYDAGRLLGVAPMTHPRWIVLTRGLGLAFDVFEGFARVTDDGAHALVDLAALVTAIERQP